MWGEKGSCLTIVGGKKERRGERERERKRKKEREGERERERKRERGREREEEREKERERHMEKVNHVEYGSWSAWAGMMRRSAARVLSESETEECSRGERGAEQG